MKKGKAAKKAAIAVVTAVASWCQCRRLLRHPPGAEDDRKSVSGQ